MNTRRSLFRRLIDSRYNEEEQARFRALPSRQNEYGYDAFGFHREDLKVGLLFARFMFYTYFRGKAFGVENIPAGRVMLVANHSGQLPYDGVALAAAAFFEATPPRVLRAMVERFVPTLPFVGTTLSRWGQVLGTVENCQRLLEDEECILVFPEGSRGISKPFTRRYQLADFGLGFIRLALASKAPILPVAVVGAEEQAPAVNVEPLARLLGVPAFPLMPFPPFFPAVPLPSRYRIYFGEPRCFAGDPDDDDEVIAEMARQVKLSIESMIRVGRKERGPGL
ncbi:MAG: glycerol acyltransferase [Proteobacteria bacterium]|nr:MAG: glycerol acyltransferase [Pseudomonadota bacterium]PIE17301.1 MAG: glycerol acyltransferase [Pseudomonadota bacterium]